MPASESEVLVGRRYLERGFLDAAMKLFLRNAEHVAPSVLRGDVAEALVACRHVRAAVAQTLDGHAVIGDPFDEPGKQFIEVGEEGGLLIGGASQDYGISRPSVLPFSLDEPGGALSVLRSRGGSSSRPLRFRQSAIRRIASPR